MAEKLTGHTQRMQNIREEKTKTDKGEGREPACGGHDTWEISRICWALPSPAKGLIADRQ